MADLFELIDLASYLQRNLDEQTAIRARRIAAGWLMSATKLSAWPDPVPDNLFAWGLELAGLAYVNPEGLTTETVGGETSTWEKERRKAILAEARAVYVTDPAAEADEGAVFLYPQTNGSWL